jgi:ATP-dependent Lon protease
MMFEDFFYPQGVDDDVEFMPLFQIDEDDEDATADDEYPETLPVLALKNTVLFPGIVIPITVGRDKSLKAIQKAYAGDRMIAVLSQKDANNEDPDFEDLYHTGTVARIVKLLKMPDGTATAILQGRKRFAVSELTKTTPYLEGRISVVADVPAKNDLEFDAIISSIKDMAKQIIELSPNIPSEAVVILKNINKSSFLLNFIASNLGIKIPAKQQILETNELDERAESILHHMDNELQLLELKDKIEGKVRGDIEKQQRDYYLNQQLKTIQEELGGNPQEGELKAMMEKAETKKWPTAIGEAFKKEITRLGRVNPQAAEYSVLFNYIDLLLELPWNEYTKDEFDLKNVKKELDKDHFGLEKVKDRILEHLAVLKLKGDMKSPIICLVGPPGVGKTSLGRSIANALGRKFVRMSLGGLHDESEIRGHRKTYIGAMPGRIIQSIKKAKTSNPVFILDEIDKVGRDHRGDPSSALLEVLDPEQNETFQDNYLDLEYDLSKVLFIATANSLSTIQPALLDRMEIIHVSGYSTEEKIQIAKNHLVAKQRKAHGLKAKDVKFSQKILKEIVEGYTRESGVRGLDRQIAGAMRGIAKQVAMEEEYNVNYWGQRSFRKICIKKLTLQELLLAWLGRKSEEIFYLSNQV